MSSEKIKFAAKAPEIGAYVFVNRSGFANYCTAFCDQNVSSIKTGDGQVSPLSFSSLARKENDNAISVVGNFKTVP